MTSSKHLRRSVLVIATFLGTVGLGGLVGGHARSTPIAYAATCQIPWNCGIDTTVTSALNVQHVYDPQSTNQAVEPNTGETWSIVATWNDNNGPNCGTVNETSTVDVDWNGTTNAWALANVNLSASVNAINICTVGAYDCSSVSDAHSYGYKLILDVFSVNTANAGFNLYQVVYTTTAVDTNGFLLNLGSCTLGASQTVNGQTWTVTDPGSFGCSYTCNEVGPTVTIEY